MRDTSVRTLTTPMTVAECRDYIHATLEVRGAQTNTWKPGAVVRTIIYAFAILAAAFSRLQAAFARSFSLDLSEGRWLTIVAKQVYGVDRLEGTFASGEVLASNAGAASIISTPAISSSGAPTATSSATRARTRSGLMMRTFPSQFALSNQACAAVQPLTQ